jgi:hypothetical protein
MTLVRNNSPRAREASWTAPALWRFSPIANQRPSSLLDWPSFLEQRLCRSPSRPYAQAGQLNHRVHQMKPVFSVIVFCLIAFRTFAADTTVTNESADAQEERLFQRYLKEMREEMAKAPTNSDLLFFTNLDTPSFREIFKRMIVDPSFGYRWDEVPAPTLAGSNALSAVNSFVATNGWNMQTNDWIFDSMDAEQDTYKPIRGLPWIVIHDREFSAVTHNGILYVSLGGFHHDGNGVAYNPNTNRFSPMIDSFKPIGQHWYVWIFDHEEPHPPGPQKYEGSK